MYSVLAQLISDGHYPVWAEVQPSTTNQQGVTMDNMEANAAKAALATKEGANAAWAAYEAAKAKFKAALVK